MFNTLIPLVLLLSLYGCGKDYSIEIDAAEQRLDRQLENLAMRISALEKQPSLTFEINDLSIQTHEDMFQPILDVKADFHVKGEQVPHRFYMDVELVLEVPGEQFNVRLRQVFMVENGYAAVAMTHPLPAHDLKTKEIKVSLTPLNWYPGIPIKASDIVIKQQAMQLSPK